MGCSADIAKAWLAPINESMRRFDINTLPRQAYFLAQIGHESNGLKNLEEIPDKNGVYGKNNYENRKDLGNTWPGAGRKYIGRSPIQLTGARNYLSCEKATGIPCFDNPDLLLNPEGGAMAAAWFWASNGCNELADKREFTKVTKRINGGTNGMADRRERFKRCAAILGMELV